MSSTNGNPLVGKHASKKIDLTQNEWSNHRHSVEASSKEGYMCHITMNAELDLTPEQMFAIFTHPDNSHIFRDLGRTVKYKVSEETNNGNSQTLEIEQQAVFKFLAIPVKFTTKLYVYVDFEHLTMSFKLAKWGTMRKFEGHWEMEPVLGEDGRVVGTKATLEQDVLPLIVPPLLKGFLSGVSANVVRRLLEDLEVVARRVAEGENLGKILGDTEWMEKNPTLKEWREKMEVQWDQDHKQRKANEAKAKEAKAKEAKEAKANEAKANEARANEAKVNEAKANEQNAGGLAVAAGPDTEGKADGGDAPKEPAEVSSLSEEANAGCEGSGGDAAAAARGPGVVSGVHDGDKDEDPVEKRSDIDPKVDEQTGLLGQESSSCERDQKELTPPASGADG